MFFSKTILSEASRFSSITSEMTKHNYYCQIYIQYILLGVWFRRFYIENYQNIM